MNPEIMVIGDTHGNLADYRRLVEKAGELGINKIFQAGDCGLFPALPQYIGWLDDIQRISEKHNVQNYWIRGNHDDPDEWERTVHKWPSKTGWGTLRSRIFLAPRVHYFKLNNARFLGVGGAVSIDKQYRLSSERKPNTLWWPNEAISVADVDAVENRHIDVLISHECSNYTHFRGRMKSDPDSESNRQRLDEIIRRATPDVHFHGHMHTKYDWENYLVHGGAHSTQTYGLECSPEDMYHGPVQDGHWGIFNTDTFEWAWEGDKEW